jgi:hypothetical protein
MKLGNRCMIFLLHDIDISISISICPLSPYPYSLHLILPLSIPIPPLLSAQEVKEKKEASELKAKSVDISRWGSHARYCTTLHYTALPCASPLYYTVLHSTALTSPDLLSVHVLHTLYLTLSYCTVVYHTDLPTRCTQFKNTLDKIIATLFCISIYALLCLYSLPDYIDIHHPSPFLHLIVSPSSTPSPPLCLLGIGSLEPWGHTASPGGRRSGTTRGES